MEEYIQQGKTGFHSEVGSHLRVLSRDLALLMILQNHSAAMLKINCWWQREKEIGSHSVTCFLFSL